MDEGEDQKILTMISVLLTSWNGLGLPRRLPKLISLPRGP